MMLSECRPSLLLVNGHVRTMVGTGACPTAVAIGGGRILAVGSDADIRGLGSSSARVVDLAGRSCTPGFFDSHFHYYQWAIGRTQMDLAPVRFFGECMETVAAAAAAKPDGTWLQGYGFNETDWTEEGEGRRIPLAEDLDAVAPGHPVLIYRCDLHLAVANSKALQMAGIGPVTEDPEDGTIDRDVHGNPTGVLREGAIVLVRNVVPDPDDDALPQIMQAGLPELWAMGITSLHDVRLAGAEAEAARTFRAWQKLRDDGDLDARVWAAIPAESLDEAVTVGLQSGFGDERLRLGCVKFFTDGGMGARTAWMLEPFADTGERGVCLYPLDELKRDVLRAHKNGLAVMVHCIGDRANREVITIFESLHGDPANRRRRPAIPHRIEHAQVIRPEDLKRLGSLEVAVSAQPTNMILDINMIDHCAPDQTAHCYPFAGLMGCGAPVMFSSDAPVCDPSPLLGIQSAVTRARLDGEPAGGWRPEQKVTLDQALAAYTATPAAVHGAAHELGAIAPGARADLAVLGGNIDTAETGSIASLGVDMTIFDGEVVHER